MTSSKNFVAAAVLAANLFAPLAASAAIDGLRESPTLPTRGSTATLFGSVGTFCARIGGANGEHIKNADVIKKGGADKSAARVANMDERREGRETRLVALREEQDARVAAVVAKLDEEADTDAEKAAVEAFRVAVAAAVESRRAAVKAANETLTSGIKKALDDRKVVFEDALAGFRAALVVAGDKAKADCASADSDESAIRESYVAAVMEAKSKLKDAREMTDRIGGTIKPLVEEHKASLETAFANFKDSLSKAQYDLKTAKGT